MIQTVFLIIIALGIATLVMSWAESSRATDRVPKQYRAHYLPWYWAPIVTALMFGLLFWSTL